MIRDCLKHTATQVISGDDNCLLPSNPHFTTPSFQVQRQCLLVLQQMYTWDFPEPYRGALARALQALLCSAAVEGARQGT